MLRASCAPSSFNGTDDTTVAEDWVMQPLIQRGHGRAWTHSRWVYPTHTVGIASRGQQVRSSTDQPGALVLRKDRRSEHAPHHRAYLPTMCVREIVWARTGVLGPAPGAPCGCSDLGRRLYNMEVNIIR